MDLDRVSAGGAGLARAGDPYAMYGATYRARLVSQRPGLDTVDVIPDDPALPTMADIPLRFGVPGARARLKPGSTVLVGWEGRRPDRPYATSWLPGTAAPQPLEVTLHADAIQLGGPAVEAVPHGTSWSLADDVLMTTLQAAFAALQAAAVGPLAPLAPGFAAGTAAIATYKATKAAASRFLSAKVRTQ